MVNTGRVLKDRHKMIYKHAYQRVLAARERVEAKKKRAEELRMAGKNKELLEKVKKDIKPGEVVIDYWQGGRDEIVDQKWSYLEDLRDDAVKAAQYLEADIAGSDLV